MVRAVATILIPETPCGGVRTLTARGCLQDHTLSKSFAGNRNDAVQSPSRWKAGTGGLTAQPGPLQLVGIRWELGADGNFVYLPCFT